MNLDNYEIEFECPNCNFSNKVTLRHIRLGEKIICSGCHEFIQLVDKDVSTSKTIKSVKHSIDKLTKSMKNV